MKKALVALASVLIYSATIFNAVAVRGPVQGDGASLIKVEDDDKPAKKTKKAKPKKESKKVKKDKKADD